jgi:hypothetical protein
MGWSAAYISIASVLAEAAAPFNSSGGAGGFTVTQTQRNFIALAVAGLSVTYLLFRSKFRRKNDPLARQRQQSSSGGGGAGLAQQRAVERQMQQLLVELSEMARQISAQLDTRATKLELLIKEADEKLAALESARKSEPLALFVPPQAPALPPPRRASSPSTASSSATLFDTPRLTLVESNHDPDAPENGSDDSPHPGVTPAAAEAYTRSSRRHEPNIATLPDPRHAEIYALADEGRGPAEIARHLGRPSGEIELILALRPTGS